MTTVNRMVQTLKYADTQSIAVAKKGTTYGSAPVCKTPWRLEVGETANHLGDDQNTLLLGTLWDLSHQLVQWKKGCNCPSYKYTSPVEWGVTMKELSLLGQV